MTSPTVAPVVLPDGRLQIGSVVLTAADAASLADFIVEHQSAMQAAAAAREATAKAVTQLAEGLRATAPAPVSFGSTNRGRVTATVAEAADVDAWAEQLGTTSGQVKSQDGSRVRREASSGAFTVATAWAASPAP
jgi:hypothetical protein